MNKEILLQSIKTASGFLALFAGALFLVAFILSNIPPWLGAALIIIATFIGITYLEYKNRLDKHQAEVWKRLKDGIK